MENPGFEEIQRQVQRLYQEGDYTRALELASRMASRFPEHTPLFTYWRISMAARLEEYDLALRLLQEFLDQGYWYGETLLRRSPSLLALQENPGFERLVERNRQVEQQDRAHLYPMILLHNEGECEPGDLPCPLLLALHANGSTAQASLDFWRPAASAGWLVAVPQSSQAMWKDAYIWDDLEITSRELQRDYGTLQAQYSVSPEQTVIAGRSMGGEIAVWSSLSGQLPARGFIAVAPSGPFMDEPESWKTVIEQSQDRELRGYFIVGANDQEISLSNIQALADWLIQAGVPCEVESLPGADSKYLPSYGTALLRGLEYIMGES